MVSLAPWCCAAPRCSEQQARGRGTADSYGRGPRTAPSDPGMRDRFWLWQRGAPGGAALRFSHGEVECGTPSNAPARPCGIVREGPLPNESIRNDLAQRHGAGWLGRRHAHQRCARTNNSRHKGSCRIVASIGRPSLAGSWSQNAGGLPRTVSVHPEGSVQGSLNAAGFAPIIRSWRGSCSSGPK